MDSNTFEFDTFFAKSHNFVALSGPWPDRLLIDKESREIVFVKVANKRHRWKDGEQTFLQSLEEMGLKVRVWVGQNVRKLLTLEEYMSGGALLFDTTLFVGQAVFNARSEIHRINKFLEESPDHPQRQGMINRARYLNTRLAPVSQIELVVDRQASLSLEELERVMSTPQMTKEQKLEEFKRKGDIALKQLEKDQTQTQEEINAQAEGTNKLETLESAD